VVVAANAMSVITAPAAMIASGIDESASSATHASSVERAGTTPRASRHSNAGVATPNSTEPKRAASSLTPRNLMLAAWTQNDKGGLAKNGTLGSLCGVIQSPEAAINQATSPYRASVVSLSG
jgi:hypothetical protein